jgi:hypothetical protein
MKEYFNRTLAGKDNPVTFPQRGEDGIAPLHFGHCSTMNRAIRSPKPAF